MTENQLSRICADIGQQTNSRSIGSWNRALWYGGQSWTAKHIGGIRAKITDLPAAGAGALVGSIVPTCGSLAGKLTAKTTSVAGKLAGKLVRRFKQRNDDDVQEVQRLVQKDMSHLISDCVPTIDRNIAKLDHALQQSKVAIRKFGEPVLGEEKFKKAHDALRAWAEAAYYHSKVRGLVTALETAAAELNDDLDKMQGAMDKQVDLLCAEVMNLDLPPS